MPDIDVPAIIEAAAYAIVAREVTIHDVADPVEKFARDDVTAALPAIAEALYAPILELHKRTDNPVPNSITVYLCEADHDFYPCQTVRVVETALDAIRGQA